YDPDLNPTYAEFAQHYGSVILPARPYHARDKAKVEQAVLLAERWILAVLRNRIFYSLAELQTAVALLLERLNTRPSRHLGQSRRELFEAIERVALRPLPPRPYELALWARPKVSIDYHVEFEDHYYSVPWQLRGERLDLRARATAPASASCACRSATRPRGSSGPAPARSTSAPAPTRASSPS